MMLLQDVRMIKMVNYLLRLQAYIELIKRLHDVYGNVKPENQNLLRFMKNQNGFSMTDMLFIFIGESILIAIPRDHGLISKKEKNINKR